MAHRWSGVIPVELPEPKIERVDDAIFCPPRQRDGRRRPVTGIFRSDGTCVNLSGFAAASEVEPVPGVAPGPDAPRRAGVWVFGGHLLRHFGHVLIDTAARLWAVRVLQDQGVPVAGVIFFPRAAAAPGEPAAFTPTARAVFDVFDPGVPMVVSGEVERIETLYVPQAGISAEPELFAGQPAQRRFLRDSCMAIPPNAEPRDVYVSRRGKGARGSLIFEAEIERAFAAEGYTIFHPEGHRLREQVATYRSARRLVSIDGSALHVVACAVAPDARVAVLSRRAFYAWAIADQLRAFSGCDAVAIEAHGDVFNPADSLADRVGLTFARGWSSSFALPDLPALGAALVAGGFLSRVPDWPAITPEMIEAEVGRISARHGVAYVRVPDELRALEPHAGAHLAAGPVGGR